MEALSRDYLLLQLLYVNRLNLIRETRKYYSAVLFCVSNECKANFKQRCPEFNKPNSDFSITF